MCIRGARSSYHRPVNALRELAISEGRLWGFGDDGGQDSALVFSCFFSLIFAFFLVLKGSHRVLVSSLARNSARLCGELVCTNEHRIRYSMHITVQSVHLVNHCSSESHA